MEKENKSKIKVEFVNYKDGEDIILESLTEEEFIKRVEEIVKEGPLATIECGICGKELIKERVKNFDKVYEKLKKDNKIFKVFLSRENDYNLNKLLEIINNSNEYTKEEILEVLEDITKEVVEFVVCDTCFYKLFY